MTYFRNHSMWGGPWKSKIEKNDQSDHTVCDHGLVTLIFVTFRAPKKWFYAVYKVFLYKKVYFSTPNSMISSVFLKSLNKKISTLHRYFWTNAAILWSK